MKNIYPYILEKLKINKSSNSANTKKDLSKVKPGWKIYALFNAYNKNEKYNCFDKIYKYYEKQEKPSKIVNRIKDNINLTNSWFCTILLQWDDAIQEFKNAILDRGIINSDNPEEQLDGCLYQIYCERSIGFAPYVIKIGSVQQFEHALRHYFDLYNIQYNN